MAISLLSLAQAAGVPGGLVIESSLLPPLTLLTPTTSDGSPGQPSDGPLWLQIVRPKITAQTIGGAITIAPGGDPPDVPWVGFVVGALALVVLGLAGYGAMKLAQS